MTMNVTLIAHTQLAGAGRTAHYATEQWLKPDYSATDAEALIEFAGRACYQSWDRPNPETARARDYVRKNIIAKAHESVLEHASATFYITGVSRSLTHELIRHRHLSFSELSQRYVDVSDVRFVMPPAVRDHMPGEGYGDDEWHEDVGRCLVDYQRLTEALEAGGGLTRKRVREAARSVMPNATETKIVVTGNLRAWRHVIRMRGSEHADAEIRELALLLLDELYEVAPSVFEDFAVVELRDGRRVIE